MRRAEEIKAAMAAALEKPHAAAESESKMIFLEVLLDIRGLLDSIDSWSAHTEGHADKLRKGLVNDR